MSRFRIAPQHGLCAILICWCACVVSNAVALRTDAPWSMEEHDAARTSLSPFAGPGGPSLSILWQVIMPWSTMTSSPIIGADGTLYCATVYPPSIYAMSANTSAPLWNFTTTGSIPGSLALGTNGLVYGATDAGVVHALSAVSGVEQWRATLPSTFFVSIGIGPDGMLYVPGVDAVYAIRGNAGTVAWKVHASSQAYVTAAAIMNGVVVTSEVTTGTVVAMDASTGGILWVNSCSDGIPCQASDVSISPSGAVYVLRSYNDITPYLYALSLDDGSELWHVGTVASLYHAPAVSADAATLYVNCAGVCAFDAATGTQLWQSAFDAEGPSTVDANGVLFTSNDRYGMVYATDGVTGATVWSWGEPVTTYGIRQPIITADGVLILAATNGTITALTTSGGSVW